MKKEDLKLIAPKYEDQVEVYVCADVNDADYIDSTTTVSLETYSILLPIFDKIEAARIARKPWHNWEDAREYLTKKEISLFEDKIQLPYMDNCDIHSIVEITCYFQSKEDSIRYEIH